MTETRWGITIPLPGVELHQHRSWFNQLEAAGYTDVWTPEGGGFDAFTPLTLAAAWSSLRLGAGVVSSFTRGPGLLANTAAAMAQAAPGRFVLGIGSSSNVIVENWNGVPFDRPYQRTRDVVTFLRAAFRGERIDREYESFTIGGFRQPALDPAPPIVVAALHEQMLRLAGRLADGAMINWVSATDASRVAAVVRAENPSAQVIDRIMVCPTDDAEAVYRMLRPLVASYTAVGVYRRFHEWLGRGDALAQSWKAWDSGDRAAAAAAVPESVIDELCVHGRPDVCRDHLRRFVQHGVTTPVIALILPDGADLAEAIQAVAPAAPDPRRGTR